MSGEGSESLATDDSNLVVQAVHALAQHAQIDPHVSIHVDNSIPRAGGMAGGSADAAGTLVACAALWGTGLSREELADIGARLGSDVPFALVGANAIGRGRGEEIMPVLGQGQFHWVFALADEGLSTPAVYRQCDTLRAGEQIRPPEVSDALLHALRHVVRHPRLQATPRPRRTRSSPVGRDAAGRLADLVVVFVFLEIDQNGRPGGREPPQSISFDETSRIKSV